jgi:hypothetical protein
MRIFISGWLNLCVIDATGLSFTRHELIVGVSVRGFVACAAGLFLSSISVGADSVTIAALLPFMGLVEQT